MQSEKKDFFSPNEILLKQPFKFQELKCDQ